MCAPNQDNWSACAFMLSDPSLHCFLKPWIIPWILYGCKDRSESLLVTHTCINLDKARSSKKVLTFFLFLHKNIYCGYSLEAPH